MHRRGFIRGALALPLSATTALAAATPVVLELFTSQGCSSCPPADAYLGELARNPGIIALAWHVDYWNSLGWRDPFARREWTDRQRAYAKHLDGEVYTPALVVNGATMVVGSDKAATQRAIDQTAPLAVSVALRRTTTGLEADIGSASTPVNGVFVTYDPQQVTRVEAGENGGRRLVEYRVVRDTLSLNIQSGNGQVGRLTLPPVPEHMGAAVLIQDSAWRVVGAADLPANQGA